MARARLSVALPIVLLAALVRALLALIPVRFGLRILPLLSLLGLPVLSLRPRVLLSEVLVAGALLILPGLRLVVALLVGDLNLRTGVIVTPTRDQA